MHNALHIHTTMKENNGRARRDQLTRKLCLVFLVFFSVIFALFALEHGTTIIPMDLEQQADDYYHDGRRRHKKNLWHKLRKHQKRGNDFAILRAERNPPAAGSPSLPQLVNVTNDDKKLPWKYNRVLAADVHLIDIQVTSDRDLRHAPDNSYDGIMGIFCQLDFSKHKEDPSAVPMFRDLVSKSKQCQKTRMQVPLKEIATLARNMDERNHRQPTSQDVPKPLNISAVVFHESRCGSTLVANTLIGMNPAQHRVYSESPPPVTAMKICGDEYTDCTKQQAAALLRDVLYMMGRTNDPNEERVFFKIQSVGSRHIEVFRLAFPQKPWLFVYRDPVQVMMSHLAAGYARANCMRSVKRPPKITQRLIKQHGHDDSTRLLPEEFCAAHLATITETALANIQQSGGLGMPINYASLPTIMYESILPNHLGVRTTQVEIDNIQRVSGSYSKGRGERKKEWEEDSTKKEAGASPEIRQAAQQFLSESYAALQTFATSY